MHIPVFPQPRAAPYTSVIECVRSTLRHSGLKGPFQGLSATLLRNAPANSVYLGSFEVMKQRAAAHYACEPKDLSAPIVMAAGGTGGILYWLMIFPGACRWAVGRGAGLVLRWVHAPGLRGEGLPGQRRRRPLALPPRLAAASPPASPCPCPFQSTCSGCDQERHDDRFD